MGDYAMNLKLSKSVCDQRQYPDSFAYPLPAVLFWDGFDQLNFSVGSFLWLCLISGSMIGSFVLTRVLAQDYGYPYDGIGMALAFGVLQYYLFWDLKTANINSFYLIVVLFGAWCWQKEKLIWAGTLLALATAIKIYSIAFLPYILLRRKWQIGFSMIAAMVVFFLGIPVLYFGWHDTAALTRQWVAAVLSTSNPQYILHYHAYKISMLWIAMLLLNPEASGGRANFLNWNISSISLALKFASLIWLLVIIGYFAANRPSNVEPKFKRLAFTLDMSILLMCFFPLSPFLQPHHLVALVVPAVCLTRVLFDASFTKLIRSVAGSTLALVALLTNVFPYPYRGIGVMLSLLAFVTGIWIIRRTLCPAVDPEPMSGPQMTSAVNT